MVDVSQLVVFTLASVLGKIPVYYLFMLIWAGLVIGLMGQAMLLLIYVITMIIAFGIIRPIMANIVPFSSGIGAMLYGIPSYLEGSPEAQQELVATLIGLPVSSVKSLISGVNTDYISRFLFLGIPDVMIFPSAFLYGYGTMTADNGAVDSRNMLVLFFLMLSILVQMSVMEMKAFTVILNVLIGIVAGVVGASVVSEIPSLRPFNIDNQSFKIVVRNNR
jgi:hypothetical protein